jgi:hypothetical protein
VENRVDGVAARVVDTRYRYFLDTKPLATRLGEQLYTERGALLFNGKQAKGFFTVGSVATLGVRYLGPEGKVE